MILLQQMLLFAVMMGIGYGTARKGILDKQVTKSVSWLVVNVSNPALILSGCLSGSTVNGRDILRISILAFVVYFVLIGVSWILSYTIDKTKENRGLYQAMMLFSNMGFMGLPLMAAVYGNQSVIYISMFLIPFNLLIYTYGLYIMRDDKERKEQKSGSVLRKIVNPGVVASVIALVFSLSGIQLNGFPVALADSLGALTGPLSMMVIGASFSDINIKELFQDKRMYLISFYRLLLIPLLGMLILMRFIQTKELLGACYVVLAAPVASMTVMFSKQYRKDDIIATKAVAFSTLLSVITMPFLMSLLKI